MQIEKHFSNEELEAGLDHIRQSPKDEGRVELIVRRPQVEQRQILQEGELNMREGLAGDNWKDRGEAGRIPSSSTQLTIMNARVAVLVAGERQRWALAGDQLFIDLDLSKSNLPAGTRLSLGSAVIEISEKPHTGCSKFASRFGLEALKFISSPVGKELQMRGIYAQVVQPGVIHTGDIVRKLPQR
jgi:MOSC domain-containing protein YiiM